MKRKFSIIEHAYVSEVSTRSKKPRLLEPLQPKKRILPWVSATSTRNYVMDNMLVDVLKMYHKNGNPNFVKYDALTQYLMDKGNEFEKEVVQYINKNCVESVYVSDIISDQSVQKTIDYMKQGVPLIHSAPVRNKKNGTHGIIDLLVRSDYLKHIVENNPLTPEEECISAPISISKNYHYVVIDIKFSTLPLRADGKYLLNQSNYKAYKTQLCIYNKAISNIQGYTSRYAFILGRRWLYKFKGETFFGTSCLDRLGVVDFEGIDSEYVNKTNNAIRWVRDVIRKGGKWEINPPSHINLYPNICVSSGIWDKKKMEIAISIGEISMLWYCGVKERKNGFSKGIKSWKDKLCNSHALGVNGTRSDVINKIIEINRQDIDLIRPTKIKNHMYNWRNKCKEVFVDFETIMDVCSPMNEIPEQKKTDIIFMIGVACVDDDNNISYRSFIANKMNTDEEFRIMSQFVSFMKELGYPNMWYWSAEKRFWSIAENRQFERLSEVEENNSWKVISDRWIDMSEIFRKEPITIKGCFGFGLKHISEHMRNHGMITEYIKSCCDSGTTAMVKAIQAYEMYINSEESPVNSPIMKDIEAYNKFDCVVLYDILKYLRENH